MTTVAQKVLGSYYPLTDLLLTLPGATDAFGVLLTGSTAVCKAVVRAGGLNGSSIVTANMTYSGTPGTFTYTVAAASLSAVGMVGVLLQIYDVGGTTLHYSAPMELTPAW